MLACVCVFFNPAKYKRILQNYFTFRENFPKTIPFYLVEASFSGQFETDAQFKIKANPFNQTMWQKERMINWIVDKLPDRYNRYMYSDADILFEDGWDSKLLEMDGIVQNFREVDYLGLNGEVIDNRSSAFRWVLDKYGNYGVPGASWTYPREIKQYDRGVIGAGDAAMERALTNREEKWAPTIMGPIELNYYYNWANETQKKAQYYKLQYLDIKVKHLFHGTRDNRNYIGRHDCLRKFSYNPLTDVHVAKNGLLSWCSYKPNLHTKIKEYFKSRKEDDQ